MICLITSSDYLRMFVPFLELCALTAWLVKYCGANWGSGLNKLQSEPPVDNPQDQEPGITGMDPWSHYWGCDVILAYMCLYLSYSMYTIWEIYRFLKSLLKLELEWEFAVAQCLVYKWKQSRIPLDKMFPFDCANVFLNTVADRGGFRTFHPENQCNQFLPTDCLLFFCWPHFKD